MAAARTRSRTGSACGRRGGLWRSDQLATLLAADFEPDELPVPDEDDEEAVEEPESDLVVEEDESDEDPDFEESDFEESDFDPESALAAAVAADLALSRESLR